MKKLKNILSVPLLLFFIIPLSLQAQWNYLEKRGMSDSIAGYNRIAVHNGIPYAAYRDNVFGNRCTVMYFDGSIWQPLGNKGFSSGTVDYIDFKFINSTPYVVYKDAGLGNKGSVMKFDGANWVNVGSTFGGNPSLQFSIDGSSDSSIYVAYADPIGASTWGISVSKFDGTNWNIVGSPNLSKGNAQLPDLVINNDNLYVVFVDKGNENKLTLKKFNGSDWIVYGDSLFTPGATLLPSMTFIDTTPYINFVDVDKFSLLSTMKLNGTNWEFVGSRGYSIGAASHNSIVYNGNALYSCFTMGADSLGNTTTGSKVSVKKYNGLEWVYVGDSLISDSSAAFTRMAISNDTIYVGFRDEHFGKKMSVIANYTPCTQPDIPAISADQINICEGDSVQLYITNSPTLGDATKWVWRENSENGNIVGNGSSVQVKVDTTTTYFIRGEGNCVLLDSSNSITITTNPKPVTEAGTNQTVCSTEDSIMLNGGYTNATSILWSTTGNGIFSNPNDSSSVYYISNQDTENGEVSIILSSNDNGVCPDASDTLILFINLIELDLGSDLIIDIGDSAFPDASSTNYISITWSPNYNLSDSSVINPFLYPSQDTSYMVTIQDANGCSISDTISVKVLPIIDNGGVEALEIRNIITPNGDLKNDYWTVNRPELLENCVISVINRWGKEVYSSIGYNNDWDATYNGEILPDGTYYYIINCGGDELITDEITIIQSKP